MATDTQEEHANPYTPSQVEEAGAEPDSGSQGGSDGLRKKILNSLSWELGGQFGLNLWRFAGNMVLTRLLAPDAFGVIGLAHVYILAISLLSNVGISDTIIYHKRGKDPAFLDTVWTISNLRGIVLWLLSCAGAYPFGRFYDLPELYWVLPVVGFSSVIRALASMSIMTAKRDLKNSWYVIVDSGSQIIGTTMTVVLAFMIPSVAALTWGWICGSLAYTCLSYCRRDIRWHRFRWDAEAVHSLSTYGRWAMASSGMTILQERTDRLVLGKVITATQFGQYVIGANLAALPMSVFWQIQMGIAQPVYARIRHESAAVQHSKIRRLRLGLVGSVGLLLVSLVILAPPFVRLIYGESYHPAGWFCQLAALAALIRVATDLGPIFMAYGDGRTHFAITFVNAVASISGVVIGFMVGQASGHTLAGVLYGFAFGPLLAYPYQASMYRKVNAWFPLIDLTGVSIAVLLVIAQYLHLI